MSDSGRSVGGVSDLRDTEGVLAKLPVPYLLAVLALVVLPVVFSPLLANEILLFAIFAMGYNLLLGYGGELSFGHAALIASGAYAFVFTLRFLTGNFYVALVAAIAAGGVVGVLFAVVSLRRRGIYFAMITLALAQMLYFLTIAFASVTGGRDGIAPPPTREVTAALGPFNPYAGGLDLYVFSVALLIVVWAVARRIIHSPFGRSLVAIRENEERAVHLGYKPNHFLTVVFGISGVISGLAGGLYVTNFVYVTSSLAYWSTSGEVVLMTILGGVGSLGGPVAGAAAFVFLTDILVSITSRWRVFFGAIIMAVILFAPGGLAEIYDRLRDVTNR